MRCIVELIGDDPIGRKMIAWGRRIGCVDAGHGFNQPKRKVITKLLVDDSIPSHLSYLLELADNPTGLYAITPVST
jgi:hypothetical protein